VALYLDKHGSFYSCRIWNDVEFLILKTTFYGSVASFCIVVGLFRIIWHLANQPESVVYCYIYWFHLALCLHEYYLCHVRLF